MESQLRPKEIQARIRAGATVEQVAALAGTSSSRVERFAYPVLLERASVAEQAVKARPAIDGITAGASVAETVAATLSARGHDGDVTWDAFKDDEGWVLALSWNAGRSENRAHWLFHPGPDGGTLSARDDAAAEIVDPALRILRPLRPVGLAAATLDPTVPTERPARVTEPVRSGHPAGSKLPAAAVSTAPSSSPTRSNGPARDRSTTRSTRFGAPLQPQNLSSPNVVTSQNGVPSGGAANTVIGGSTLRDGNAERIVEDTVTDERAGVNPVVGRAEVTRTGTEPAARPMPGARPAPAGEATGGATPGVEVRAAATPSARPRQSRPGGVSAPPCRRGRTCCWVPSPAGADGRATCGRPPCALG